MHKTVKHINTIKKINKNINIRIRSVLIEKSPFLVHFETQSNAATMKIFTRSPYGLVTYNPSPVRIKKCSSLEELVNSVFKIFSNEVYKEDLRIIYSSMDFWEFYLITEGNFKGLVTHESSFKRIIK